MSKNVKITISAVDKTKKALSSTQKGLATLKKSVFSLKGALIGLGAGALLISIAKISARFEDLRDSLSSVTGSIENGRNAFNFISEFATRTQFGVEELSRSFITLKASGIEPTEKLLRVFTDTAAVTTDQLGTLDAMTRVFSRGVQGGLGLEELNQIADRGVPVFKILEDQLGITRLEIAQFGRTTEGAGKILDALQVGLNKEFGGATETKLDNLSIATSNLQIALATAADEFGEAGFTGALTDAAVQLTGFIEDNKEGIKIAGEYAGEIVDNLAEAFVTLARFIGSSRTELLDFLDALGFDIEPRTVEDFTHAIKEQNEELDKAIAKQQLHAKITKMFFASGLEDSKLAQEKLTQAVSEARLKLQELEDGYHHFRLAQGQATEGTQEFQTVLEESTENTDSVVEALDTIALGYTDIGNACQIAGEKVKTFDELIAEATTKQAEAEEEKKKVFKDNIEAFKKGKFEEIDMEKLTNKQMGQMGREALAEGAKHSKKMFKLNQALMIGEAIMSTATGVANALKLPFPVNIVMAGLVGAMGMAQVATIRAQQPPAQFGGSRLPNSPFLVGERGPELFTPNTAGSVTPNHQLASGSTNISFNITTVDADGFEDMLQEQRGTIISMINSALNEQGRPAIV